MRRRTGGGEKGGGGKGGSEGGGCTSCATARQFTGGMPIHQKDQRHPDPVACTCL